MLVREVAENLIYPEFFWRGRRRAVARSAGRCGGHPTTKGRSSSPLSPGLRLPGRARKRRQKQPVHCHRRRRRRPFSLRHGVPACNDNSELALIIHTYIHCIIITYIYICINSRKYSRISVNFPGRIASNQ